MSKRVLTPRNRGFLFLDSHPAGCERLVADMWQDCPDPAELPEGAGPVALIIGSSAGYGLAATVAGLKRAGVRGIAVSFEKAPTERRTATAGWYRTAATADLARTAGRDLVFLNGDAFSDTMKNEVADLIEQRFGGRLDYLIYSVAAPRRTDPDTGTTHASVLKPIGRANRTKTLVFDDRGVPAVREVETGPAEGDDVEQTVAVMGGADWERWIDHLAGRGLLGEGFATAALSYIGSPLTAAIYRQGTIGAAKAHLEATARTLNERLGTTLGGRAVTSVNGAAVTQSSTAIPGIALYTGLLRGVLGADLVPPVQQLAALWDQLTGTAPLALDDEGRVRLDTWELTDDVQAAVAGRWEAATTDTIAALADLDWFHTEVQRLYGFAVPGVDYTATVATDVPWPVPTP
ncbi:enoyl-[acyl-carrier-protein] reductase [NADH] [Streptomyces nojiriensis]|uniref:trans-2-enoyl-CoA reductase (NAD(+)) n=1 Tax=Streptomyces nojiriensis TaxID=66374 RepID=A0ABQ3SMX5_9ACTN|nr:enoyl-[acyl-carrier-protein] reductase FabV [Streptomyces nojiriensis]QTI42759.1 Enoyl-[acyl-carrier-protein] reductase [NADH] [Streptomyces nojiriensis]GGS16635.1 enoyl-[acyl-carrier-protein] reductase [NADH] [Streptomyces nojiriensis]GHI69180.1 enoyl-[acyl-carrier-protein] reductase [NADH] [Streptomyces nojiriensis]